MHRRILPGEELAGYRVEELAGRGGMGEVYLARDTRLDRPVALKLLNPALADDEGFRERLLRESRLAAGLDHPNVIPIYEAGEADGRLFIAMRYVEGTDLKALLRREGMLEPARAIAIAAQVADALDAAHRRGLVHRDVKPSNVLIDEQDGREHCYLADFGLTQSVSDRGPTDGRLMGTLDYVAPEQIRGDEVDGRADVYALGCLVFESLTGTLPFSGASDTALVYAHLEEEPPRATDRRPELPVGGRRRSRSRDGQGPGRPPGDVRRPHRGVAGRARPEAGAGRAEAADRGRGGPRRPGRRRDRARRRARHGRRRRGPGAVGLGGAHRSDDRGGHRPLPARPPSGPGGRRLRAGLGRAHSATRRSGRSSRAAAMSGGSPPTAPLATWRSPTAACTW